MSAQDDPFGVGDKVRLEITGRVANLRSRYVGIECPDGMTREFTYGPDSVLTLRVTEKAYADGGVYLDSAQELYRYHATRDGVIVGWYAWSAYRDGWGDDLLAVDYPTFPVHRLDGE